MPKRRIVLSSIMVLATALVAVFSLGIFQSVMNLSDKSNAADSYVTSPYTSFYNGNGVDISSFDVSGQASYYYDERWDIGWINSGQYGVIYAVNDGEQIGPGLKNIYSYYKKNYPSAIYDFDSYYNESDFANYYKRTYYNGYHTSYSSTGVGANVGYGAEAYGYLYAIDSIQGFNNFATLVAKGFTFAGKIVVLECDLDFGGQTINPVGNNGADLGSFCGIFDGNYHTLSNFTINRSGAAYVGLFSSLSGGMITRLRVKNATIGGSGYAYELYAGGLVGVAGSTGTIYDYGFSSADSYGTFAKVGMVGYGESTIDQCIVENVTLKNSNTSGLNYYGAGGFVGLGVGDSSLLVLDCISRGITYSGFADSSAVFGPAAVKNTNSGPTYTIKRNEGYADNAIFRVNIHTSAIDKVVTQWTRNWYASIADFSEDETIRPYTNTDMAELDEVYSDNLAYGMQWSSIKGEDSSNPWYFVEPHGGLGLRGFMGWKKIRVRVGDYESYDCDDTWSYPYVTNPVPSTDSLWEIETEYPYMPYTWVSSDAEITLGEITSGDELTVSNYVFRAYGNSLYVFDEWNMSAIKGNGVITYTIGASFKKIGDCVVEFSKSDTMVGYNWYSYCGYYYTVSLGSGWSWLDGSYSSTFAMAYDTQITFYENYVINGYSHTGYLFDIYYPGETTYYYFVVYSSADENAYIESPWGGSNLPGEDYGSYLIVDQSGTIYPVYQEIVPVDFSLYFVVQDGVTAYDEYGYEIQPWVHDLTAEAYVTYIYYPNGNGTSMLQSGKHTIKKEVVTDNVVRYYIDGNLFISLHGPEGSDVSSGGYEETLIYEEGYDELVDGSIVKRIYTGFTMPDRDVTFRYINDGIVSSSMIYEYDGGSYTYFSSDRKFDWNGFYTYDSSDNYRTYKYTYSNINAVVGSHGESISYSFTVTGYALDDYGNDMFTFEKYTFTYTIVEEYRDDYHYALINERVIVVQSDLVLPDDHSMGESRIYILSFADLDYGISSYNDYYDISEDLSFSFYDDTYHLSVSWNEIDEKYDIRIDLDRLHADECYLSYSIDEVSDERHYPYNENIINLKRLTYALTYIKNDYSYCLPIFQYRVNVNIDILPYLGLQDLPIVEDIDICPIIDYYSVEFASDIDLDKVEIDSTVALDMQNIWYYSICYYYLDWGSTRFEDNINSDIAVEYDEYNYSYITYTFTRHEYYSAGGYYEHEHSITYRVKEEYQDEYKLILSDNYNTKNYSYIDIKDTVKKGQPLVICPILDDGMQIKFEMASDWIGEMPNKEYSVYLLEDTASGGLETKLNNNQEYEYLSIDDNGIATFNTSHINTISIEVASNVNVDVKLNDYIYIITITEYTYIVRYKIIYSLNQDNELCYAISEQYANNEWIRFEDFIPTEDGLVRPIMSRKNYNISTK